MTTRPWDCTAYGPQPPAIPEPLCFFAAPTKPVDPEVAFVVNAGTGPACTSLGECRARMSAERQRLYLRIQEQAAAGDALSQDLAAEFTNPDQLLNAEATPRK